MVKAFFLFWNICWGPFSCVNQVMETMKKRRKLTYLPFGSDSEQTTGWHTWILKHCVCVWLHLDTEQYLKETAPAFFCWPTALKAKQDDKFIWDNNASTVLCRPYNLRRTCVWQRETTVVEGAWMWKTFIHFIYNSTDVYFIIMGFNFDPRICFACVSQK